MQLILYLTLGWFGIQMAMALDATKFQVMLDNQVHNALIIGAVLSLGPLAGITIQPLIGLFSDRWTKMGLSRKKLILFSLCVALFSTVTLSIPLPLWSLVLVIALFYASFNVLMVCYRAVVTETSQRKALLNQKGLISGFVALFSGAGSFSLFALCSALGTTSYPFWISGFFLLLTFVLFFAYAPKAKSRTQTEDSLSNVTKTPDTFKLFQKWNILFYALPVLGLNPKFEDLVTQNERQKAIFRLFTVMFFSWIGIQALRGYFVLYVTKALHLDLSLANALLAILTLCMVGAAIPLGKLADKINNQLLYRYCLIFFSLISFCSFILVHSLPMAIIMSILLGISFAGMIVLPLSLLFKLCPENSEGVYAGLYNLFLSVPQLYSLVITGWLIEKLNNYQVILLVSGIAVLIAFLASYRMFSDSAVEVSRQ